MQEIKEIKTSSTVIFSEFIYMLGVKNTFLLIFGLLLSFFCKGNKIFGHIPIAFDLNFILDTKIEEKIDKILILIKPICLVASHLQLF
jgi:hypothetical protein